MAQPIEVHFWPTPNGLKVTIALEEMGLPYEIKPVNIGAGDQFKPEFLAISPNNRMPAIVDPDGPDGKPISIFESGAILQYLGRKTGQFYPADERGRVEVDEWVFWQMANLGPNMGQANHFRNYASSFIKDQRMLSYGANRYSDEVHRLIGVLNRRLEGREFICGAYTIADMITQPWVSAARFNGIDMDEFPNARDWHARVAERPAVKKATEEGQALRARAQNLAASGPAAEAARKMLFGQRAR